jgi:hypothetical protein
MPAKLCNVSFGFDRIVHLRFYLRLNNIKIIQLFVCLPAHSRMVSFAVVYKAPQIEPQNQQCTTESQRPIRLGPKPTRRRYNAHKFYHILRCQPEKATINLPILFDEPLLHARY